MFYLALGGFVFICGHLIHAYNERDRQRKQQGQPS